jgi:undecaprenyl pyrophosphate synthase
MTPRPLLGIYAARLRRQHAGGPLPSHVGLIMDVNRRRPAFREVDSLRALRGYAARRGGRR